MQISTRTEGGVVAVVTVEPGGRAGVPQDVSGAVTKVIVRCVRSRGGDFAVAQMLAMAGEHRPVEMLEDLRSWSTHDEAVSLLAAAERVTGETSMGWCVGEELLRQRDGAYAADLLRSLGSPAELLRNVTAAAGRLFTVSSLEPLEVGQDHAVLRAVTRPRLPRHRYLCELTKGMLSQVPAVFGLSPAVVDEPECQARGGRCCLYCLAWEVEPGATTARRRTAARSEADPRAAAGAVAAHQTGAAGAVAVVAGGTGEPTGAAERAPQALALADRLEEAARSTTDLVSGDDVPALLAAIAARAAGAAGASRYLLAMRQGAGHPPRVLQAGLDNAEAGMLARELLASGVPVSTGARLVVDVATIRHHYGRFAAFYHPGEEPPAGARRILTLHANCAAAAMELATAAATARRSEAATGALVDLSGALSRSGTIAAAAQALADAVPALAGCDRSSVLLWDPFEQRLILQAWSVADGADGPNGSPGANGAAGAIDGRGDGTAGEPPWSVADSDAAVVPVLSASRDVVVVDPATDEPSLRGLLDHAGATCSLLVPLFSDEEFVGLVAGEHLAPPRTDPRADGPLLALLRAVADQAVTALQNSWLLEQVGPLAWHDALTGLPNRRLLEHRARRAVGQTKHLGAVTTLFFVDVDRFKRVNDTFGHATGDALIRQVAQRLRDVVRRQDTVARLGGDEFAVLLPDLPDMTAVRQMAARMLQAIRAPYHVDGDELHTSASIGVALCPDHGDDYDELLIHADEAMYRSKGLGRDTYTVYAPDAGPADGEMSLDPDLHHAVERNELFVVYQPTVDLRTNRVVGLEALVRWRHPSRGVIEPGAFIAQAEESEVIVDIDRFVLREVARQVREWIDRGVNPVRVSVNVSRRDLVHPRFADTVLGALREHRLPGQLLEIELTEQLDADDTGVAGLTIDRLRREGVRFAVDDFGAGTSSLERLAALPVRRLKIDRSLVQLIGPADELGPLTSAIIAAAGKLGMECVAEGVETPHQRTTLLQGGCTAAQGHLYGRPLLPDGVQRLLQPPPAASPAGVPADAGG